MNCLLQTHSFLHYTILIDDLKSFGLFVNFCDVFISCLETLDFHDGTHSLQKIH